MLTSPFRRRLAIALLGTSALVACSPDQNPMTAPTKAAPAGARHDVTPPDFDPFIFACKLGGPAGTYHFHLDIVGGGEMTYVLGPDATVVFDGTNQACAFMAKSTNGPTWGPGVTASVTVTETQIPTGLRVDSISVYSSTTGILDPAVTGATSVTKQYGYGDKLWFGFYNGAVPNVPGSVEACKTAGPAGNYTFRVDVTGGGPYSLPNGTTKTLAFNGTTSVCATMYVPTTLASWPTGTTASVKISEVLMPFGVEVQSITVLKNGVAGSPVMNAQAVVVPVAFTDVASVKVADAPWQLGNQGCSISYWKTHPASWTATGYSQTRLIGSVLTVPATFKLNNKGLGAYTMLEGLSFVGGTSTEGKAELLIRSTMAGLLNAASPSVAYASPTALIVGATNLALASNNSWVIGTLAAVSDLLNANKGGCPLN